MKKYIDNILMLGIIIFLFYMVIDMKQQVAQVPKLQHTIDSLEEKTFNMHDEIFNLNVELGRHETTRDEVLSKHKAVRDEYYSFYNSQTE